MPVCGWDDLVDGEKLKMQEREKHCWNEDPEQVKRDGRLYTNRRNGLKEMDRSSITEILVVGSSRWQSLRRCDGQRLKQFSSNDLNCANEVGDKVRRTGGVLLEDLRYKRRHVTFFWDNGKVNGIKKYTTIA